jgi:hypothetical protein
MAIAVAMLPTICDARIQRSAAEVLAFKRHNPCPSTGQRRGACPGWQIDHVQPLCSGGPDTRANMQWLTVADHRVKTRADLRVCRYLRKIPEAARM